MEEIQMKVIVCENYDEMSAKAFGVMKELLDAKKDAWNRKHRGTGSDRL